LIHGSLFRLQKLEEYSAQWAVSLMSASHWVLERPDCGTSGVEI